MRLGSPRGYRLLPTSPPGIDLFPLPPFSASSRVPVYIT